MRRPSHCLEEPRWTWASHRFFLRGNVQLAFLFPPRTDEVGWRYLRRRPPASRKKTRSPREARQLRHCQPRPPLGPHMRQQRFGSGDFDYSAIDDSRIKPPEPGAIVSPKRRGRRWVLPPVQRKSNQSSSHLEPVSPNPASLRALARESRT